MLLLLLRLWPLGLLLLLLALLRWWRLSLPLLSDLGGDRWRRHAGVITWLLLRAGGLVSWWVQNVRVPGELSRPEPGRLEAGRGPELGHRLFVGQVAIHRERRGRAHWRGRGGERRRGTIGVVGVVGGHVGQGLARGRGGCVALQVRYVLRLRLLQLLLDPRLLGLLLLPLARLVFLPHGLELVIRVLRTMLLLLDVCDALVLALHHRVLALPHL